VNESLGSASFTVTLSSPSSFTVTVNYSTDNVTAIAGEDYTASQGTLTFVPGETSKAISIEILYDALYEITETFTVNLSNPTNATILDGQGIGTILDYAAAPLVINEIGLQSLNGSCIEILHIAMNASPASMVAELGLIIVGQDGQVIHISEGFISLAIPAGGMIVLYENGTLEVRKKGGEVINSANWVDNAMVHIGGVWIPYNPAVHGFSFGDTTADPLLVNLLQSGVSIDYFTANNPSANMGASEAAALGVYSVIWFPPAGPPGVFLSFDGSLTDDVVFERVFITVGSDLLVYEPGEIDSHTAVDWTTSSTPTIGVLNPTQVTPPDPATPDVADGQTIVFGTEGDDTLGGEARRGRTSSMAGEATTS